MHHYSELGCVIPGKGLQTLYRATSYSQVLAFRSNNALRFFKGSKVVAMERKSVQREKCGWLYMEELNNG